MSRSAGVSTSQDEGSGESRGTPLELFSSGYWAWSPTDLPPLDATVLSGCTLSTTPVSNESGEGHETREPIRAA